MTPFHDTPAPTLLIPIIDLITRIYLAYRLCTHHVRPPFAFRINQGRPVPVSLSLVRDLPLLAKPSISQKFYIIELLSDTQPHTHKWVVSISTLYIMYYQNCRSCLICTNTSYVTPDFHTIPTPGPFSYSS